MNNLGVPAEEPVYIGVWTNWSDGKVLGSTLTLSQRDGGFLVAFLALFVSFVGSCFFRVTSFALHIQLSTPRKARDAVYHQRQAILRNSESGANSLWRFTQLGWYWRRQGSSTIPRLSPFYLHAALCTAFFAIAGLFSSRIIALTGDSVLISSEHCSIRNAPEGITFDEMSLFTIPYMSQRVNSYVNYVQDCYGKEDMSGRARCSGFVKSRLPYTVDYAAPCPFDPSICKLQDKNILLDTGLLDSHADLGLNAPSSERIKLRLKMHCAPLVTEPYKSRIGFRRTQNDSTHVIPYTMYSYGTHMLDPDDEGPLNYTFYAQETDLDQRMFDARSFTNMDDYILAIIGHWPAFNVYPIWTPPEAMALNDTDVYLIGLTYKSLRYSQPVDDPWFSAHTPSINTTNYAGTLTTYLPDELISPLGCTKQVQLCLPPASGTNGEPLCSTPGGLFQLSSFPEENSPHYNRTAWMQWAMSLFDTTLAPIIQSQGGSILQAKHTISAALQAGLPDNQWQIEVERLFGVLLAGIQASVVETATGPADLRMMKYREKPETAEGKYFCGNQKIRSTAYSNFSVFGLAFTIVVGTIIIILNLTIESIHKLWVRRYPTAGQSARLEWAVNGTLQLQRLAHEAVGYGSWSGCDEEVPLTLTNETLAMLDIDDAKHPKLEACGDSELVPVDDGLGKAPEATYEAVSDVSSSGSSDNDDIEIAVQRKPTVDSQATQVQMSPLEGSMPDGRHSPKTH